MADSTDWRDWERRAEAHFQRAIEDVAKYPAQASGELHFAAELYLKAVLLFESVVPSRTHILKILLQNIDSNLAATAIEHAAADVLTEVGFKQRYPSDFSDVSPEEASAMQKAAQVLRTYARAKLGLENL